MKYCSNCGTQLPDNAQFCASCGTPQQATIKTSKRSTSSSPETRTENKSEKKTLGQKMMDNYRTNMALRRERIKNLKWWHWVLIAMLVAALLKM
jgi:uncharacterized membrane protein YvbJ